MMITIIQLYPRDMNLYGDWGNTLTLKKRLEWRGFAVRIIDHNPGDTTDFEAGDIFIGGGGQDAGQEIIQDDLLARADELRRLAESGVPMLMICGMYQLFGRAFTTHDGRVIRGAGILPLETYAKAERLIGNITLESEEFGQIVGYENHSGQTLLDDGVSPLGRVVRGAGNDETGQVEGARLHNIVTTYLHGPILPKNPRLADFLITAALTRKGYTNKLSALPIDRTAEHAQRVAMERGR